MALSVSSPEPGRCKILLVDDQPEKLVTLKAVLAELGEELVEANSGREALRRLLEEDFALILLDVNMPGMDGFETATLIRQRKSSEDTPIIFVTAFSDDALSARGYSLGAVDYIITPFVPEVLKSKVSVFVDLYKKTEQVTRQATSLERRANQLKRLTEASLAIHSAVSIEDILRIGAETAREVLHADNAEAIAMPDEPERRMQAAISRADGAVEYPTLAAQPELFSIGTHLSSPLRFRRADLCLYRLCSADGPIPAAWIAAPLTTKEGSNVGVIQACRSDEPAFEPEDENLLTQVAQMTALAVENTLYAEVHEANRLKDEFLATLSHELRTPLTAILGWTRILRATRLDEARLSHGLDVIERSVTAQAKLIEDLLDISRIRTNKLRLQTRPVRLVPIVEAAIEAVRPAAESKVIALTIEKRDEADDTGVIGDPDRLEQVVWNLLSNALKFTGAGGNVRVSVERRDDRAVVRVTDTGRGITPEFLAHVFDRFRQAESGITRTQGGLGLGLALVKHIVGLHGGSVSVASAGPGRGSVFTVELPALRAAVVEDTGPVALSPRRWLDNPPDLAGLRILVVDDEPDAREVLSEILRAAGADVVAAPDAQDALRLAGASSFEVLVSDIAMPGGDGYELLARLRAREATRDLPAIALTAYARIEDRERALGAGFQRHLSKPVEPAELLAAIATLARRLPASRPQRPTPGEPAAGEGSATSVLIIEDDDDSRDGLKTLLELNGYRVEVASNGADGLARALAQKPRIALVDIGLPEIDGLEVAVRLRREMGAEGPYLVALSGYADTSDRERAIECGFDAYLVKPINPEELNRVLLAHAS